MKVGSPCVACLMRQAWETVQAATNDEALRVRCLREVGRYVAETPVEGDPASYSTPIYHLIGSLVGGKDVYADVRRDQNALALALVDHVEKAVREHADPLAAAARVAAAGNLIDSGVGVPGDVEDAMIRAADRPLARDESAAFFNQLHNGARSLLYILDNAGEIVFDALFMRVLKDSFPSLRIVASVKGGPIINDALLEDARTSGVAAIADEVVTTGLDAVGAPLGRVGAEFAHAMERCDVFLSKGQGNFETLDRQPGGFLVLTAKCAAVAEALGVAERETVFAASG